MTVVDSNAVILLLVSYLFVIAPMGGSRGGQGVRTPPPRKITKNIGFLSNSSPDPLKITKLPSQQHSMLGHHQHASETPFNMAFRWRADDGPHIVVFGSSHPSSTKKKRCQSWTPFDNIFWIRACSSSC